MRYFSLISVTILTLWLLLQSSSALSWPSANDRPIVIHTYSAGLKEYELFLKGRDVQAVSNYSMGEDITRRVILEMVLMEQALALGGFNRPVRYQHSSDDLKTIFTLLEEGKYISHTDSFWLKDIQTHKAVLSSEPLLRDGEYVVGLYTSPENHFALDSKAAQINRLSAVSSRLWSADWQALDELGLKRLEHARHWRVMAAMVQNRDVDFMLVPFQGTDDHSMGRGKLRLIPIPNVKVTLHDSRHIAVSEKHTASKAFLIALNSGLTQLRASGTLARAYREAGVIDARVDDWLLLNPSQPIKGQP